MDGPTTTTATLTAADLDRLLLDRVPLAEAGLLLFGQALDDASLDALFDRHRGRCYERVLTFEKLRDETGREMHKSWGNSIDANEAMERMGADVMRFMYADHLPQLNLNFGYGPANEVKRRLLTFWNSTQFFLTYASIEDFKPIFAHPLRASREGL